MYVCAGFLSLPFLHKPEKNKLVVLYYIFPYKTTFQIFPLLSGNGRDSMTLAKFGSGVAVTSDWSFRTSDWIWTFVHQREGGNEKIENRVKTHFKY